MTKQPDAPKTVRRHRRVSVAKRNLLLALSVFVFAFGLVVVPVGDPPLLGETEPAAASHCGPGDYQWLCLLQENCAGTLVGLTCVIPTTTTAPPTTTTTTQPPPPTAQQLCVDGGGTWVGAPFNLCWHQPSCPAGQHWVGQVNGSCQSRCAASQYWVNGACRTRPCTPDDGQHRHIYAIFASTCHDDHTTANTCGPGQVLDGHDQCRDLICTPDDGQHRHIYTIFDSTCHDDHTTANTCGPGQVLDGHDQCRDRLCTPDDGQHRHIYTIFDSTCHDDHTTANTCNPSQHLNGHETCHDHTCPAGQHMAPFPQMWVYKYYDSEHADVNDFEYVFTNTETADAVVVEEWEEVDSHTGCSRPLPPPATETRTAWDRITGSARSAVNAAVDAVNSIDPDEVGRFIVESNRTYIDAYVTAENLTHQTFYLALCIPEVELVTAIASAGLAVVVVRAAAKAAKVAAKIRKAAAFTGVGLTVAVSGYVVCNHTSNPFDDQTTPTTTTTTTTTTLPPTTTTTAVSPPSLPVVNVVPDYDTANYRLRFFYDIEAVPSSCTPWVYWQLQPSVTLLLALCPR